MIDAEDLPQMRNYVEWRFNGDYRYPGESFRDMENASPFNRAYDDNMSHNARAKDAIEFINGFSENTRFTIIARDFS